MEETKIAVLAVIVKNYESAEKSTRSCMNTVSASSEGWESLTVSAGCPCFPSCWMRLRRKSAAFPGNSACWTGFPLRS